MIQRKNRLLSAAAVVGTCAAGALAQTGPDVIVCALPATDYWGQVNGINGYSVATTSGNIGTLPLAWNSGTTNHPVIPQSMYRWKDGRFTMVGQSWLKHAFATIDNGICGSCSGPTGQQLYPGCSDPYGTGLNGSQGNLGPKFEVNATTGAFNANFFAQGQSGNAIFKRLQVARTDIDVVPTTSRYVVESQYIAPDDAAANNGRNNASWQEIRFTGLNSDPSNVGSTQREEPAIFAWQAFDPSVELIPVDYNDGGILCRFWVGAKVVNNNDGTWTYTYAVQNMNSDRSAQAFIVPLGGSNLVTNDSFVGVQYHSGEPYDNTDWSFNKSEFEAEWSGPTFAENQNGNALRWNTLYSFQLTANSAPVDQTGKIRLFKPGAGSEINVNNLPSPSAGGPLPLALFEDAAPPSLVTPGETFIVSVEIDPRDDSLVSNSAVVRYRKNGGAYDTIPLTDVGGNIFEASLEGALCEDNPEWYFTAEGVDAGVINLPAGGSFAPYSTNVGISETTFSDDATTDKGWTMGAPGDTATTGIWERAVSVPTGAQPEGGVAGPSDMCFVTGNAPVGAPDGDNDVDGGTTSLVSPIIDLDGAEVGTTMSFFIWFNNSAGLSPNEDAFRVDLSDDDGGSWSNALTISPTAPESNGGWFRYVIAPAAFVNLTDSVRVRFVAEDVGNGSLVEAAVDFFAVDFEGCANPVEPATCACDWNDDGNLNDQDFFDWVNDFVSQTGPQAGYDFNQDTFENDQDWFDFINCFVTPPVDCQ